MFDTLTHGELLKKTAMEVEADIAGIHKQIEEISERNEWRVLQSYRKHKVSDTHFTPSTGYGYDDIGRDTLESIYADVFGGEAGLVRRKSFQAHMRSQLLCSVSSDRGTSSFISRASRMIR